MKRIIWALALTMCLISAGCQKETAKIAAEAVTLNTTSISLAEGESATVSATISPSNATNQKVIWTTSNSDVATVENGVVTAISVGKATVTATSDDGGKTATCEVMVRATEVTVTEVTVTEVILDKITLKLEEGSTWTLTATIIPSNANNQNVTWSSTDTNVATVDANGVVTAIKPGTATITVKSQNGGYSATCAVTVISVSPAMPQAVDLGLSSGLKWASFNLGATKPEEYGGYYQWGGLLNVADISIRLDWSNCPYHTGTSESTGWTKYVPSSRSSYWSGTGNPDNKTVLEPEDDVAHVKLGGKWRMPTREEFNELISNCSAETATLNGTAGIKFTSKKNSKSIFLPAAGIRNDYSLAVAGTIGYYWSSSLYTNFPCYAYESHFLLGVPEMYFSYRFSGLSIRPVSD